MDGDTQDKFGTRFKSNVCGFDSRCPANFNPLNLNTMKTKSNGLMATRMTAEEVKKHSAREYNSQVWESNVDRMIDRYKDVEFYLADKGDYEYDRFYVVYTLPEGLRLLNTFSYSGGISSRGFYQVYMLEYDLTNDSIEAYPEGRVKIESHKLPARNDDGTLDYVVVGTHAKARQFMSDRSRKFGDVWTKEWM